MQAIPTISYAQAMAGGLPEETTQALATACEDHGFFLLDEHGEDVLVERVFATAAEFFAQPRATKLAVARDEANPLGYFDRELTKQKRDQKEVFDFKAGGYLSSNPAKQTRWPEEDAAFREVLTEFFTTFTRLSENVMRLVLEALGMPAAVAAGTVSDGFGDVHSSAARLNFYPPHDPVPAGERPAVSALGDMALHHHTDPGAITLLLQDAHGGLQARSKVHGWIDVAPRPGTIVVNVGDVLQVWTNDRCTAGMHRVLPVAGVARNTTGRFSVPFFYQPRYDAQITPWVAPGETAHYTAFSWRDYIRGRVTDNFADYGVDDIQITRYRIGNAPG